MKRLPLNFRHFFLLVLCMFMAFGTVASPVVAESAEIVHLSIEGVINPIKSRYIDNSFRRATESDARLIIISINTPGGLVTSMQEIVETIANSSIPVVTFVEPQTSMATSAGTFIVLAGDVAAMVPGSSIGSAHPVGGQGEKIEGPMEEKVVNVLVSLSKSLAEKHGRNLVFAEEAIRSSMNLTAEQALETGVIEIIADDLPDLIQQLEGYRIENNTHSETLALTGIPVTEIRLSEIEQFLDAIANPSVATVLMTIGVMGLLYEFSSPGMGLGAVVGSISLILGLISMSALPIHMGGVLLLCLGMIMLLLEYKIPSGGLLTIGGVVSIVLGTFFFVDADQYYGAVQEVQFGVVLPVLLSLIAVFVFMAGLTLKALTSPQKMGVSQLVGQAGSAKSVLDPKGSVFVDGALWDAESTDGEILKGDEIVVESVEGKGRSLKVKRSDPKNRQ